MSKNANAEAPTALRADLSRLHGGVVAGLLLWTALIVGSHAWDVRGLRRQGRQLARNEAAAGLKKDQAFRLWATSHGGVYVSPDERTPPNPYLAHIPDRDVKTLSGKSLTLMNPAYMVRQMMAEYGQLYGARGRLTSLKVLNPANAPDEWERQSLRAFAEGERESAEFTTIEGEPYLRMMRPMITEKACLKCHAHQGYKEGDVRGGVSLAVPMGPYLDMTRHGIVRLIVTHAAFWLVGVAGIGLAFRQGRRRIRERHEAGARLLEYQQRLRALASELSSTEERQRRRIAADLHDRVGQGLVVLKVKLEFLREAASSADMDKALSDILEGVDTTIEQTRSMTFELCPPIVYDLGLEAGLGWLVEQFQEQHDFAATFDSNGAAGFLDDDVTGLLFRAVQELLINVAKHARAHSVKVSIEEKDRNVKIAVEDDGVGFDASRVDREGDRAFGFGLFSIRERLTHLGGQLSVRSGAGQGTRITLLMPLGRPKRQDRGQVT